MEDARLAERLISAERDERRRVALFLHDGPVQSLAGIALMLDAVSAAIDAGEQLGEKTQIALYTIVRELLDQAVRRNASRIGVSIRPTPEGGAEAEVRDDAAGERRRRIFEAIEERVTQLHGTVEVTADEAGNAVRVVLPASAARR